MPKEYTIVVVDDDESIMSAFRNFLVREGVQMVSSPNTTAAMGLLEQRQVNLLIIDIGIPIDSGLEFIRNAKMAHPSLPIIAITGYTESITEEVARSSGAAFFFAKPLDLDRLRAAVRRSLLLNKTSVNPLYDNPHDQR